jgi:hypothetical protein
MRCSRFANGTTSKLRSCFYSRERLTLKRRKTRFSWQGAIRQYSTRHARLRARRLSSPCLKAGAFSRKGTVR